MASNYTPQAEDVIAYRGEHDHRVEILKEASDDLLMHVSVYTNGEHEFMVETKSMLSEMVNEFGWTLVSRKEVQDGK